MRAPTNQESRRLSYSCRTARRETRMVQESGLRESNLQLLRDLSHDEMQRCRCKEPLRDRERLRLPESTRFVLPGIRFFNLFFKVRRPRESDEQPHQQCRGDGETSLIKESDWNETENQVGTPPEPDVLVKYVEGGDSNNQEEFFHGGQKVARH